MSTPAQSIWADAVADAAGKANSRAAPLTGHPGGTDAIWSAAVDDARGLSKPVSPTPPTREPEPGFWQGSPSIPGLPMQASQTLTPEKYKQGLAAAGETAAAGAVAGGAMYGAGALGAGAVAAAPGAISTLGDLAAAHPVAAYVIKRLVTGGLIKAGWEGLKLLGAAGKSGAE